MTQPEEIVQLLLTKKITSPADIKGCTDQDIAELESTYQLSLPAVYKRFLKVMGRGAGMLFADCSWTLTELAHANNVLHQKLQMNGVAQLPKSTFVFLECGGAEILFFDTKDGDDPPVYLMEVASEPAKLWCKSFSEWLSKAAKEAARLRPDDKEKLSCQ